MTPEHQLCDELFTCWINHGAMSDEFQSLINQATQEFDTRTIVFTLTAICVALLYATGDTYLGGLAESRQIVRDHITHPKETHDV